MRIAKESLIDSPGVIARQARDPIAAPRMNLAVWTEILDPTSVDVGRALVCTNPNVSICQTPQLSWRPRSADGLAPLCCGLAARKLEAAVSDQTLAAPLTL